MQGRRNDIPAAKRQVFHLVGNADNVSADLPGYVYHRRRATVSRDQQLAISDPFVDSGDLTQAHLTLRITPHYGVSDVVRALVLRAGQNQKPLVVAVQPPYTAHVVGGAQTVGDIRQAQPMRQGFLRIDNHRNFTGVGRLHFHLSDAWHATEQGLEVVHREVV